MTRKNLCIFTGPAQCNLKWLGAKTTGFQAGRASKNYTLSGQIRASGGARVRSKATMLPVAKMIGRSMISDAIHVRE
jgi:hypothetical protein